MTINTAVFSSALRRKSIRLDEQQILIANLSGSQQEADLSEPVNCEGYGRLRHFKIYRYDDWSPNPLPIQPALRALRMDHEETLVAQVFQNSACNWRCWYCYVDFSLLAADPSVSNFFTADQLVQMYLSVPSKPKTIDLSGGQPDLVPEWVLWTMQSLDKRGLKDKVYLWSDDNLSNYYFWEYLTDKQIDYIANYPMYGRVACFKGYDGQSFSFNTKAAEDLFSQQFDIFNRLLKTGMDIYAYVTFTSRENKQYKGLVSEFVDRLQNIHPNLPLRTVPLKIDVFTPTQTRLTEEIQESIKFQYKVHEEWVSQLEKRFSADQRSLNICEVKIS